MAKRIISKKKNNGGWNFPIPRGALIGGCIGLGVILFALIGYGAACTAVQNSDTILPNTHALGINLGGMTETEARETIETQLAQQYQSETLTIQLQEKEVEVTIADVVRVDGSYAARAAMEEKEALSFLQGGARWIKAKFSGIQVDAGEAVSFQNLDSILNQLEDVIAGAALDPTETTYELTETAIVFTNGVAGQAVDEELLMEEVLVALEAGDFETPINCPVKTIDPETYDLQAVYDEIFTEPVDATCDAAGNIVADVKGISFDISEARQALNKAAEGALVSVDLILTDAEITADDLQGLLFRDILGTCTTYVSGTSNRINNVKLAASSCNGFIMGPGESFDYNTVVGQRTAARGYKSAGAYVAGESVDVLGGGICQVSSTIYLATLRSNLQIDRRQNHSYVSSYMPYGMDATVSWGGPEFTFTNNTEYPIKLELYYSGGQLTCNVYGTNLTGQYTEITNQVISTTGYQTVYEDTTELPAGQEKVKTTGYSGMKVKVYRNVYAADGTLISSTLESTSVYNTRNKVVLRGVAAETTPPETQTPETQPPTQAPETRPPETQAPETTPPAPETSAPETSAPETSAPAPETTAPQAEPAE